MTDSFEVGGALASPLPGLLPIGNRLLRESRFGVVVGEQFRLGLNHLKKALLQHPSNLLVILLPGALKERRISGILDEGMLEDVPPLFSQASLIENIGFHQFVESGLQVWCVQWHHCLQQLI